MSAGASSLAASGVAAHEAGHAIQDAKRYAPMRIRQALVPAATVGQSLWFIPVVLGLIMGLTGLVNDRPDPVRRDRALPADHAPAEFDASKRALVLSRARDCWRRMRSGAKAVLNAAALTYIAGFVAALGQLIYFFALSRN